MEKHKYLWEELSWPEVTAALAVDDLVIVPVGSTEEHGPHNPLGTDWLLAQALANETGRKAEALVAPVVPVGNALYLTEFPGTLALDPELLADLIFDIGAGLAAHGARRLVFINGHGGNSAPIRMAANRLFWELGVFCTATEWWTLLPEVSPYNTHDHGGKSETSLMLHIHPGMVDMAQADTRQILTLTEKIGFDYGFTFRQIKIPLNLWLSSYAENGNYGDPAEEASAEYGEQLFNCYTDYMAAFVRELRQIPYEKLLGEGAVEDACCCDDADCCDNHGSAVAAAQGGDIQ